MNAPSSSFCLHSEKYFSMGNPFLMKYFMCIQPNNGIFWNILQLSRFKSTLNFPWAEIIINIHSCHKLSLFNAKILITLPQQIPWIVSLQANHLRIATMDEATTSRRNAWPLFEVSSCTGSSTREVLKIMATSSETFTHPTSRSTRTSTFNYLSLVSVSITRE